jgi:hypothetical protein
MPRTDRVPTVADYSPDGRRNEIFISENFRSEGGRDFGKVGFRPTPTYFYRLSKRRRFVYLLIFIIFSFDKKDVDTCLAQLVALCVADLWSWVQASS